MDQAQLPVITTQPPPAIIAGRVQCSPGLRSLLEAGHLETGEVVSRICARADLRAEAASLVPAMDAALQPCDREDLANLLAAKGPGFGLDASEHPAEWWAAKWAGYIEALADFPLGLIERAFAIWNTPTDPANAVYELDARQSEFYPRASQLHTIATRLRNELARTRYRARLAADRAGRAPPPKRERLTKAEMAERGLITMDADGKITGYGGAKTVGGAIFSPPPRESPHEVAQRLRGAGVPISRSETEAPPEEAV